jgi:hypothetical protein
MNKDLAKARDLVSELQRELTRRQACKLRQLFGKNAVHLSNEAGLFLKHASKEDAVELFLKLAGDELVSLFSELNSIKPTNIHREMKESLKNLHRTVSDLNNLAQTGMFGSADVSYETSRTKRFLEELLRGVDIYLDASGT